ncbi:branched-chain amino acid ABC transporter permease [Desulfosarcina ovata]|uniref:Branched-chain amino acid ABC transporter permease n=2 Tax=Desulfosarcina ovata TaxID=83564 RepID=A0A5K8AD36_9BACT|nr:branched-chain amino acid ABC transporter permease [Desulfosarcina ovata]BBO83961.1 branched-chain amino acid ABC transporter permease [Desulfosarcina ovata subsp. sediminis]BBO90439.1 branched-chain amino acid ABC transporter permease [Desulfosarcina ovata subsp. ovata]
MGLYEISLAMNVGIYIILAVGLNLITGYCGQISLGHAAFFGIGAYCAALLAKAGFPLFATLGAGCILAGIVGAVIGLTSLRVREDFLAIVTMGVAFLFVGIVRQQEVLGGEMGISGIPSHGLGQWGFLGLIWGSAIFCVLFAWHVKRSWMGFAFEAVANDEETAKVLGLDVKSYKIAAFAMGTAMAGIAGGLYTYYTRFIIPDTFGFIQSVTILSIVAVGGIGSIAGCVVSAVILVLMPEFFRFINDYKLLLYGVLLFSVMRFAPEGLAGVFRMIFGGKEAKSA